MSSERAERPFAVFDIDGTLIRWQLFHAIVHGLGKAGHLLPGAHEQIRAIRMEWKNRRTNHGFHDYETVLVKAYLKSLPSIKHRDYIRVVDAVYDEYKDQTFTYTRDLVKRLKKDGYLLFAISGSQQEVVDRLARYHGFDDAIGATLVAKDGRFTGETTSPIFDKAAALNTLVSQHNATYRGSYAVGDSLSDASMLAAVPHPIAFNPDQALYEKATAEQWPIVVERKNVVFELAPTGTGYRLTPHP